MTNRSSARVILELSLSLSLRPILAQICEFKFRIWPKFLASIKMEAAKLAEFSEPTEGERDAEMGLWSARFYAKVSTG